MARDRAERAEPATWRELAVARSLDPARARAENRVQRFLDAAMQLMQDGEGNDFTVQEVVERSGQSLRSFYQYFAGKYELLLALFEEAVRKTAADLSAAAPRSGASSTPSAATPAPSPREERRPEARGQGPGAGRSSTRNSQLATRNSSRCPTSS